MPDLSCKNSFSACLASLAIFIPSQGNLEITEKLVKAGWTVIRVREKPLKLISKKYDISSNSNDIKKTVDKLLTKINDLGYEVKDLNQYLARKTLKNKKNADNYISKLIRQKNKKSLTPK